MLGGMRIYQIDDFVLHIHVDDPFHEADFDAGTKTVDLVNSWRRLGVEQQHRNDKPEIRIRGELITNTHVNRGSMAQKLKSIAGRQTKVIGFYTPHLTFDAQCGCNIHPIDCEIYWFEADAIMGSVNVAFKDLDAPPTVDLSIEFLSFWKPINMHEWHWGDSSASLLATKTVNPVYTSDVGWEPDCHDSLGNAFGISQWIHRRYNSYQHLYDPEYWVAITRCGEPMLDSCNCHNCHYGVASDWALGNNVLNIQGDIGLYGAPPLSVYAFKNLSSGGDIRIRCYGGMTTNFIDETTLIDIEQLNSDLIDAGYSVAGVNDVLYVGDIMRIEGGVVYAHAFLERSGVLLANFLPKVSYKRTFPGEIPPGESTVILSLPFETEYAFVHIWRRHP